MSKQERVVCAAIKVWAVRDDYSGSPIVKGVDYKSIHEEGLLDSIAKPGICNAWIFGFITNKNRFVDPVEAMKIAVKADQVGGASWRKIEIRMLNEWGITNDAKRKKEFLGEKIKGYLDFPLLPEDLY